MRDGSANKRHSPMRPKLSGVLASGARGVAREERTSDLNGS
jgi:hypothetical protein